MPHSHIYEPQPDLGLPGSIQFIRQVLVQDAAQPFVMELPGTVRTVGEAVAPSILPVGRVVLDDGGAPRSEALVTAAVADERGLSRAIGRLTDHIGTTRPKGFGIRLATPKRSFADVVSMAEDAFGSGCGCGCGGDAAPGAVTLGSIAVGLAPTQEDNLAWSDPVAAQIRAWVDYDGGRDRPEVVSAIGSWFFDCYSEWVGIIDRVTICRGSCTKNTCQCGKTCNGLPRTTCIGWNFCFCL